MGRRNKGRDINGVILLNKHLGCSSNHLLQQVKRLFNAAKAGHTGALDPLATGMLPICFGESTKFSQFLLDADKTYEVTICLGIRTTTSDADGEIVSQCPVDVTEQQLLAVLETFKGTTEQVPSIYSALKYEGKPYYYYARKGIDIPRKSRPITIFELSLLRFDGVNADLKVRCSKGTYIRSLADDIGQALACGAYVTRLHRTEVSNYSSQLMISIDELQQRITSQQDTNQFNGLDELLLPVDAPIQHFPQIDLDEEQAKKIVHGQDVQINNPTYQEAMTVRIYAKSLNHFLGLGEIKNGKLVAKRLVATHQFTW